MSLHNTVNRVISSIISNDANGIVSEWYFNVFSTHTDAFILIIENMNKKHFNLKTKLIFHTKPSQRHSMASCISVELVLDPTRFVLTVPGFNKRFAIRDHIL